MCETVGRQSLAKSLADGDAVLVALLSSGIFGFARGDPVGLGIMACETGTGTSPGAWKQ